MHFYNHPADQLAEIKKQIKKLRDIEFELKNKLLEMDPELLCGQEYQAKIYRIDQKRLDKDKLEALIEPELYNACLKQKQFNTTNEKQKITQSTNNIPARF